MTRYPAWLERPLALKVRQLGQQSLAIFALSLLLSRIGGMILDQTGHGLLPLLVVNLGGLALLVALGQFLIWLDAKPWKRPAVARSDMIRQGRGLIAAPIEYLRPLATLMMLLPLAATPFLLPKKVASMPVSTESWPAADPLRVSGLRAAKRQPLHTETRTALPQGRLAQLRPDW